MTDQELESLRAWAQAHESAGCVQARLVLALIGQVDAAPKPLFETDPVAGRPRLNALGKRIAAEQREWAAAWWAEKGKNQEGPS